LSAHGDLPVDDEVRMWVDQIRDRIAVAASQRDKTPRDFAATMIAVLSDGSKTLIAQVGDGCAVVKDVAGEEWRVLLWPDHGEYASTTTFVTDDPEAKCRIVREDGAVSALAVLTDGLERLALDFSTQKAFGGFFDAVSNPVLTSAAIGKDGPLSDMLKQFLESEAVCARTDDDKTLVVAARR
jgi:hypothetical protein